MRVVCWREQRSIDSFGSLSFFDAEETVAIGYVNASVRGDGCGVNRRAHVEFADQILLGRQFKDRDVAVFVTNIDLAIRDQRGRPGGREHIVRPVGFPSLDVEAMDDTREVGDEEQIVLDRDGSAGAVHGLFEIVGVIANVVPDRSGIRVVTFEIPFGRNQGLFSLGWNHLGGVFGVVDQRWADVPLLVWADAPQVSASFAVFGVFADGDIDQAVINHRCCDDVIARCAVELVDGILGVAIEFPKHFGFAGVTASIEAVEPAVAASKDDLFDPIENPIGRGRPLTVQDVGSWGIVRPEDFAGESVQADEAWGFFLGNGDVSIVDTVGGVHEEEIAGAGDGATAHIVLRNSQLSHHVHLPNHIGFVGVLVGFFAERAIVLAIEKAFRIQTSDFTAAGDIPGAIAIDQRCTANALIGPIVNASRGEFFAAVLPKEFSGVFIETDQATQVDGCGVAFDVSVSVICSDVHLAVGDDWIAVGFRA